MSFNSVVTSCLLFDQNVTIKHNKIVTILIYSFFSLCMLKLYNFIYVIEMFHLIKIFKDTKVIQQQKQAEVSK